ncbi:MAG: CPBP family intramembrane metalloprotease [Algoriphagus sp.]|nr:CPBP family intramembrane metalloprotease [Algoriphagus sp.]
MPRKSRSFSLISYLNWQRTPVESIRFKALDKEIRWLIGYSIFYVFAGYLIGLVILHHPYPILGATQFVQDVWYSIVYKFVLLLLIPFFVFFVSWGYRSKDLLLRIQPTLRNVGAGLLFILLGFFLNAGHIRPIQQNFFLFEDSILRLVTGVMMPLFIAALPEELFFRGYLQTRLEKKWNRFSAILISTLLFTAWHLPTRYLLSDGVEGQAGDLEGILLNTGLPVFIIGLLFAMHWSRYRNIILLILVHWAIDILPSVSSYFKIQF